MVKRILSLAAAPLFAILSTVAVGLAVCAIFAACTEKPIAETFAGALWLVGIFGAVSMLATALLTIHEEDE